MYIHIFVYCAGVPIALKFKCTGKCRFFFINYNRMCTDSRTIFRSEYGERYELVLGPGQWYNLHPAKSLNYLFDSGNVYSESDRQQFQFY